MIVVLVRRRVLKLWHQDKSESRLSCFTNCITLAKLLNLCASISHQLNRERIIPHRVDGESEQTQMMNIELLVLSLQLCLLLNEQLENVAKLWP